MTWTVKFGPAAEAEVDEALVWYENQSQGLGRGECAKECPGPVMMSGSAVCGPRGRALPGRKAMGAASVCGLRRVGILLPNAE